VHCKPLSWTADLLKSTELHKVSLIDDACISRFCSWGVNIARRLEQYTVCVGADLLELKEGWGNIQNSYVDKNPYQEEKFSETCRSNSCSRLIVLDRRGKRCRACQKLLRSLRERTHALLLKTPHFKTPNIHLTYQQALDKLKLQHNEIRKKDKKIAYLEGRFRDVLDRGVDIEEDLSTDLANVLANSNLTPAQEIFFKEQFNCSSKADPRGHRWHPYMIRLALHVHMTSRSAYDTSRNSGMIRLPCPRTLYNYSHAITAE